MSTVYIRFPARRSDELRRSPLVERLIARATRCSPVTDWRADAFRVIAPSLPVPPIAAAALAAARSGPVSGDRRAAPAGTWACMATPVHLTAGMSSVAMLDDGMLHLDTDEALLLAVDFNSIFGDAGVRMTTAHGGNLICGFDDMIEVETLDPERAMGRDLFECQPKGADAPRIRRLMSEIELWLYEHAINRARVAKSMHPVTGLWLWGGGVTRETVPAIRGWTAGRDPLFAAFGDETAWPFATQPGVIVSAEHPGSLRWEDVEERWLAPAFEALRASRLDRLELSAADHSYRIGPGLSFRFWRRSRPWWESYGIR